MMKRTIIPLFLLIFTFFIQAKDFSENSTQKNFIFLNTDPLGAEVIIDNDTSKGLKTPCLIRNIDRKSTIKLRKAGYKDYTITPNQLQQVSINADLTPISFDLFFPNETIFKINNSLTKGPLIISKLKSGTYNFFISKNKIIFKKITSFTIAEAVLITATIISALWLGGSLAVMFAASYLRDEAGRDKDQNKFNLYTDLYNGFVPVVGVSAATAGVFVIAMSSVIISDFALRAKNKKKNFEVINKTSNDSIFFESSKIFLSQGDVEKSTKMLQIFTTAFPDSKLLPEVYFQLGQNYFIDGDYEDALKYWLIFKNKYPLIKYYDYVTKNIADIYYQDKNYKSALNELEKILYIQGTSEKGISIIQNQEEITAYKARLNKILYTTTNDIKYFNASESYYIALIDTFNDSEILDIYFAKLIDLYKSTNSNDKLNLLKQKAENLKTKNGKIKDIILSYF